MGPGAVGTNCNVRNYILLVVCHGLPGVAAARAPFGPSSRSGPIGPKICLTIAPESDMRSTPSLAQVLITARLNLKSCCCQITVCAPLCASHRNTQHPTDPKPFRGARSLPSRPKTAHLQSMASSSGHWTECPPEKQALARKIVASAMAKLVQDAQADMLPDVNTSQILGIYSNESNVEVARYG